MCWVCPNHPSRGCLSLVEPQKRGFAARSRESVVSRTWCLDGACLAQVGKLPGGWVKLDAVKGREGAKKRAAAGEKQFAVVRIEQVDMAGPSFQIRGMSTQDMQYIP